MAMKTAKAKRGVFLTLDAAISLMIVFLAVIIAYVYYGGSTESDFESQLLRTYLQDAATVMSKQGYLTAPLLSSGNSNTSGMRQALRAIPASVCMQVSGYGTTVSDGLVGYWKLNEDSGSTASDSSVNGLSGVIHGSPSFLESGKSGRAMAFTPNDSILVDNSLLLEQESFTVSAWVYTEASVDSGQQYALNMPGGYSLGLSSGNAVFSMDGSSPLNGPALSQGAWHMLVGTYNAATQNMTLYYDGVAVDSGSAASAPSYSSHSPLTIGSGLQGVALDDVRIYSRPLSSVEIRQLYSNPSGLIYSVDKQGCAYVGGEIQSLTIPFAYNKNQNANDYYYAVIRAWYRGAG